MPDQTDCHFMDKTVPGNEVPEELARESLIAIAYSLPENPNSKISSETLNGENIGGVDSNREEKYRSELISISYTQSPDSGSQPVTPREIKG